MVSQLPYRLQKPGKSFGPKFCQPDFGIGRQNCTLSTKSFGFRFRNLYALLPAAKSHSLSGPSRPAGLPLADQPLEISDLSAGHQADDQLAGEAFEIRGGDTIVTEVICLNFYKTRIIIFRMLPAISPDRLRHYVFGQQRICG